MVGPMSEPELKRLAGIDLTSTVTGRWTELLRLEAQFLSDNTDS